MKPLIDISKQLGLALPIALFIPVTLAWSVDIQLVSSDAQGVPGNSLSGQPSITADGRYVTFESYASNLVPNDTNDTRDVFVKDLKTGAVMLVSTNAQGEQGDTESRNASISADGRYVTFESYASNLVPYDTNGTYDIFVKDLKTGAVRLASTNAQDVQVNHSNSNSFPSITADGRYVAFQWIDSNLVPNDTNYATDVFVKDLKTGAVTLVSANAQGEVGNNNSEGPLITPDGHYVVFSSGARDLVPNDTNYASDIFVKDLKTGAVTLVSANAQGEQGNIGFDRSGNGSGSYNASITANGRYVAFGSDASNLIPNDTNIMSDVFVKDLKTGAVTLISANAQGEVGNNNSWGAVIAVKGCFVAFESYASNLVPNDNNDTSDIFRYDAKCKP